ncbi:MAG: recombinase family protein [Rhodothermales bacterium]
MRLQGIALDALKQAGCEKVFTDQISGTKSERPGLQEALDYARAGDTLVIWRLDHFGRSLKDLVAKVEALKGREVGFRSLQESIATLHRTGRCGSGDRAGA